MSSSMAQAGRGSPTPRFFTLPGLKAETGQIAFDLEGVALSAGSACSSGKVGQSHVLSAMGHDPRTGRTAHIDRVVATTEAEIDTVRRGLCEDRRRGAGCPGAAA